MQDQDDIHPEAAVAPGYLTNHAARAFNRGIDATLKPHGLTMALIGPLLLLSWKGALLQRDIVRSSAVRQPAMVALLNRLEKMGMVARTPSLNDRRASLVELTEAGREAAQIGRAALIDGNIRGLDGFSPEEAGQLVSLLQRLIDNLDHS